jgi:hypothetical protein
MLSQSQKHRLLLLGTLALRLLPALLLLALLLLALLLLPVLGLAEAAAMAFVLFLLFSGHPAYFPRGPTRMASAKRRFGLVRGVADQAT